MNCCELFFVCVELAIKKLSLVALSHQLYFNTNIRNYIVYGLTIDNNWSYFNTYCLDRILPTKKKDTDFYQARIIRISDIIRLFLFTYGQTLCRIFLYSSFLFYLNFSELSNKDFPPEGIWYPSRTIFSNSCSSITCLWVVYSIREGVLNGEE